ncbi:adenylosuccinate synthase [Prosthecobacter vanneervenii]|uniref:Adenylosuccinate synthetase n=1 Tax=Prosthecobacter vanneervenii TaxID=48466 RepID=A0A7W8DKB5_9BACT|nr:adenylosuccinate synthase [Prosthecobacter vanneervenii]MBB5033048.1 adenylosuccinate synthase [Prosthecobacter vanneervenii]
MSNTVIVGAQWGDEGKGKIVDYLTEGADVVVRAAGGNNAGHTVISGGTKYILHLIPSGILWKDKVCVIGNGVVMDPIGLLEEMAKLRGQGVSITPENLLISETAHLVMPYHRGLDKAREAKRGDKKIGTTGRGIGPAYADKVERDGLRTVLMTQPEIFEEELRDRLARHNATFAELGVDLVPVEETVKVMLEAARTLAPHITNTTVYLHEAIKAGKNLLFEGAQGTYLDIDHGTYPFVTSSNTTSGGACTGSGVPPRMIDKVVAVGKAYTTRVGSGPFVTENDDIGDMLHNMGREFGATTGRARRCGWLDAVLVRYAVMLNGADELAITNLDGLDGLDTIQICTAYTLRGKTIHYPPSTAADLAACVPVYETHQGWKQDLSGIKKFSDLPPLAKAYLKRMEELTGARISLVGVGPDREQTLIV